MHSHTVNTADSVLLILRLNEICYQILTYIYVTRSFACLPIVIENAERYSFYKLLYLPVKVDLSYIMNVLNFLSSIFILFCLEKERTFVRLDYYLNIKTVCVPCICKVQTSLIQWARTHVKGNKTETILSFQSFFTPRLKIDTCIVC